MQQVFPSIRLRSYIIPQSFTMKTKCRKISGATQVAQDANDSSPSSDGGVSLVPASPTPKKQSAHKKQTTAKKQPTTEKHFTTEKQPTTQSRGNERSADEDSTDRNSDDDDSFDDSLIDTTPDDDNFTHSVHEYEQADTLEAHMERVLNKVAQEMKDDNASENPTPAVQISEATGVFTAPPAVSFHDIVQFNNPICAENIVVTVKRDEYFMMDVELTPEFPLASFKVMIADFLPTPYQKFVLGSLDFLHEFVVIQDEDTPISVSLQFFDGSERRLAARSDIECSLVSKTAM